MVWSNAGREASLWCAFLQVHGYSVLGMRHNLACHLFGVVVIDGMSYMQNGQSALFSWKGQVSHFLGYGMLALNLQAYSDSFGIRFLLMCGLR